MKATRKQKLRKKEEKRRNAEDRKYAVIERMLDLYGARSLICPLDWMTKANLVTLMKPGLEVVLSDDSDHDPELDVIKASFEWIIERPLKFSLDGRDVELSLDDAHRAIFTISALVKCICARATDRKPRLPEETLARLREANARIAHFEKAHLLTVVSRLSYQLNDVADQFLRLDAQVVWYKTEKNSKYPDRHVSRVLVGRKWQVPVSLPVFDGRRKAFPCERAETNIGPRPLTWNPAQLGIGTDNRELPLFVSDHALTRLRERIPVAVPASTLHNMMYDSLERPRLQPTERADGFLVEAGQPAKKLGYFVVEVYADFVFVRTFLFLTMQGTPEARCLRRKLGLSRNDIEHFRLDHLFTLACSDLGDDQELRRALAECGCDYMLDFSNPEKRVSYLNRYRNPLRRELGLPDGLPSDDTQLPDSAGTLEIERMIAYTHKRLRFMDGWTS
jgi:hypothetical protein